MEEKEQVWPPAPDDGMEASEPLAPRKQKSCTATASVLFITFLACFIGLDAGSGHKDFSESLLSNIGLALFDVGLWILTVLYWLQVAKAYWQVLKQKPKSYKYVVFTLFFGVLAVIYGAGVYISMIGLISRISASDSTP